jgi:hypothetical protein
MNLSTKLISVAAAAALVAGAGAIAGAPAQAKPKVTGTTVISFDKALAPVVAGIVPVAPAKKTGTQLSFPASKVTGNRVEHKGGIKIGALEASNPVIIIDTENSTAAINVTVAGNALPLFTIKNLKIRTDNKKQQVWQGFLHLTDNQLVVDALNASVGQAVFTPDMGLGRIRTIRPFDSPNRSAVDLGQIRTIRPFG